MKLSILICTLVERKPLFDALRIELERQIDNKDIEILSISDNREMSVGEKRNLLMKEAKGEYVCYFDDDDFPYPNYIESITKGLETDPDCVMFKGIITFNGYNPKTFVHSIQYDSYFEENGIYYRPPNHLNAIRTSIASRFKFPEKDFGEDTDWAMSLCESGLLKTEAKIREPIYQYRYSIYGSATSCY